MKFKKLLQMDSQLKVLHSGVHLTSVSDCLPFADAVLGSEVTRVNTAEKNPCFLGACFQFEHFIVQGEFLKGTSYI